MAEHALLTFKLVQLVTSPVGSSPNYDGPIPSTEN